MLSVQFQPGQLKIRKTYTIYLTLLTLASLIYRTRQRDTAQPNGRSIRYVSYWEVGVMEFGLKGTARVCRGHHGEVGIVEFGLKADEGIVLLVLHSAIHD